MGKRSGARDGVLCPETNFFRTGWYLIMTDEDDRTFVRDSLAGDGHAFEVLVERYYKVLFNTAYRMLGDPEDALDVTQATFLKAYRKLDSFDPTYRFFSWIYRIARNESLNLLERRRPTAQVDATLIDWHPGPDEEFEALECSEAIQAALLKLSSEEREVVILRHFQAMSYRDIAATLEVAESTVKSRLFEARRHLGTLLSRRRATR